MLVIGLILVLIALVVVGFVAFGTAGLDKVEIDLGVVTADLNPLEIFGLGALSIVVLVLGLLLVFIGLRRQRRKRKELQELRHKAELADRAAPRHPTGRENRPGTRPESGASREPLTSDREVRPDTGSGQRGTGRVQADPGSPADRTAPGFPSEPGQPGPEGGRRS